MGGNLILEKVNGGCRSPPALPRASQPVLRVPPTCVGLKSDTSQPCLGPPTIVGSKWVASQPFHGVGDRCSMGLPHPCSQALRTLVCFEVGYQSARRNALGLPNGALMLLPDVPVARMLTRRGTLPLIACRTMGIWHWHAALPASPAPERGLPRWRAMLEVPLLTTLPAMAEFHALRGKAMLVQGHSNSIVRALRCETANRPYVGGAFRNMNVPWE